MDFRGSSRLAVASYNIAENELCRFAAGKQHTLRTMFGESDGGGWSKQGLRIGLACQERAALGEVRYWQRFGSVQTHTHPYRFAEAEIAAGYDYIVRVDIQTRMIAKSDEDGSREKAAKGWICAFYD